MEANRIEKGVQEWFAIESKLKEVLGAGINGHRNVESAKLEQFREVYRRPMPKPSPEEKLMRTILLGEIRLLERKLFPSRLMRIGRGVMRLFKRLKTERAQKPALPKENNLVDLSVFDQIKANGKTEKQVSAKHNLSTIKAIDSKGLLPKKRFKKQKSLGLK